MLYINTFIHTILPNTPTWHSFLQKYQDDTISLERYGFSVKGVCLMLAQLHRRSSMIHTQSHQFMKAYLTWSACVYCTPNIIITLSDIILITTILVQKGCPGEDMRYGRRLSQRPSQNDRGLFAVGFPNTNRPIDYYMQKSLSTLTLSI